LYFDKSGQIWILNGFFAVSEMIELFKEFSEILKRKMLFFEFDAGGWHYCICFEEKDSSSVYVYRWTDPLPEEQFLKITDSFKEFIEGLKREDEINEQ
jgi:hypothetical protein